MSNCETSSRREDYIREMMKFVRIDIFGNCNGYFKNSKQLPCQNDENFEACFIELVNTYKFYLAFENSLCDDYVTEKYWKFYTKSMIFKANIVPVVRGAKKNQYEKIAINNSLIFADDFQTPKLLAEYLVKLILNTDMYMNYFEWKFNLFTEFNKNKNRIENKEIKLIKSDMQALFCYLCSMLHNETFINSKSNKIWKLSEWFSVEKSCWDSKESRSIIFSLAQLAKDIFFNNCKILYKHINTLILFIFILVFFFFLFLA